MGQFGLLANIQQLVAFKYITRRLAARYVLKNHSLYIGQYTQLAHHILLQYTQLPHSILTLYG